MLGITQIKKYVPICLDMYKEGLSGDEVRNHIKKEFGLTQKETYALFFHVNTSLKAEFDKQKEQLVFLNFHKYEKIYNDAINYDASGINPAFVKNVLTQQYITAMEALYAKERLLGLHSKKFKIEVNNYIKRTRKVNARYNFKKLLLEELIELRNICMPKKTEDGIVKQTRVITEDEYTQIQEDKNLKITTNILKSKIIRTIPKKEPKNIENIYDKLKTTMELEIIEKLKLAGSKTV